jgi:hypothetical protein
VCADALYNALPEEIRAIQGYVIREICVPVEKICLCEKGVVRVLNLDTESKETHSVVLNLFAQNLVARMESYTDDSQNITSESQILHQAVDMT